ncbi:MAG TPA: hypothetical protein VFE57_11270 [Cyclobacteriaceae bacterium]|nr:hypothetical protein [Cyclobacteriaceae bacterium]
MKILFLSFLALLFFTNCLGQKNIVKVQIGYGIPLTNTLVAQNTQSNSTSTTYSGVYDTYGSGFRLEVGYIRPLNTHLSLEMDGAYLMGKSIHSTYNATGTTQSQSNSSLFYEISPLLRVNLGGNKVKPYAAIGPIVGFGTITANNSSNSSNTTNTSEVQRKYSGSAAIGAKSVVGAELTQGRFVFYTQITMIAMSYAPGKSEYTKYTLNGTDQLSMLTVSQKQTAYKSSLTVTSAQPDPNQPSEQLKFYLPFSNISLNVGVMFKF